MSRAKALIERMCPMPVVTPGPGTKPSTVPSPSRPSPAPPKEKPNPFRRGKVRPGEEPRPKARNESLARNLIETGSLRMEGSVRRLIEDSDFVAKMRAAREAKKNGGKAPEEGEGEKGSKKPSCKGGSCASGEKVQHAFGEARDHQVWQCKDGKRVAVVGGMGRNKGTWDSTHSKRTASKYAKELIGKKDGHDYKVEKQFE